MYNRLNNLGDYAAIGRDINRFGGSRERLYNSIKREGALQAAPKYVLVGAMSALAVGVLVNLGKKGCNYAIVRKRSKQNKSELKKQLPETLDVLDAIEDTAITVESEL